MIITATPGVYSDISFLESTLGADSGIVPVIGSLPRFNPATNGTVCVFGVDTECSTDDTWASLRRTAEAHGPTGLLRSSLPAGGTWTPVDWLPNVLNGELQKPWIRLDMKHPITINLVKITWESNGLALRAPVSTKYELTQNDKQTAIS
jgi:hypothetical protein